jgi:predicted transposase YdaD
MGKYDLSSKRAFHLYALAWAEWLLRRGQAKIEIEAELSEGFQFIARESDTLLQVKGETGQFLALTELQTYYDPNMSRRLAAYAALAREKYRQRVYVTVIYLLPPPSQTITVEAFHEEFMGQMAHQDFSVIPVWELDAAEVLALNNPALVPFVPLMRGGATVETLTLCAKRIHHEPEAAELEVLLSTFASLVMDINTIRQIVRWDMKILLESPVYQELLKEGYHRGREEGREEGQLEGRHEGRLEGRLEGRHEGRLEGERNATIKALRQILTIRFDAPPPDLERRLEPLGLEALQQLTTAALTLPTLAEFEQRAAEEGKNGEQRTVNKDVI